MIVVFGSLNLDIFFRCERLPATGETLLCEEAETAPGVIGVIENYERVSAHVEWIEEAIAGE